MLLCHFNHTFTEQIFTDIFAKQKILRRVGGCQTKFHGRLLYVRESLLLFSRIQGRLRLPLTSLINDVRGPTMTERQSMIMCMLTLSIPGDLFETMVVMSGLTCSQETGKNLNVVASWNSVQ